MLKVETKITVGTTEYSITADVETHVDFFQKMSFFSSLPKVGPNGETDLELRFRIVQDYEYYSIVSEQAQQEYKLGQSKKDKGSLFGKGWEPLFKGEQQEDGQTETKTTSKVTTASVPKTFVAPKPQALAKAAAAATPTKTETTETPAPATKVADAAVKNQAASVLARFGVKSAQ